MKRLTSRLSAKRSALGVPRGDAVGDPARDSVAAVWAYAHGGTVDAFGRERVLSYRCS